MLRRIRLENFIHFEEIQDIAIKDVGPFFCIGQNGSGKSAFYEAIRRCMSTSKNMGISSSHDPSKPSIAMCYFDLPTVGTSGPSSTSDTPGSILSCVVGFPKDAKSVIKIVYTYGQSEPGDGVYVDSVCLGGDGSISNREIKLSETESKALKRVLKADKLVLNDLIETFKDIQHPPSESEYDAHTDCEKLLKEHVDRSVVITYPMRSIAPVQWTNSKKLSPVKRRVADKEIQERAEILSWYFDPSGDAWQYEPEVQRYFDIITDSSTVRFFRSDDESHSIMAKEHGGRVSLGIEKIPEGYFEAINCAIILAYPGFKTVCLEEPGRGMHPQMVERLRDLVLKPMKDKVVLITSHKPAFVTAWNIPRMFFFTKIRSGKGPHRLKIIQGSSFMDGASDGAEERPTRPQPEHEKTMRITTTRHFTTLYFARRILLVEGDGDLMFLTEMKALLLGSEFDQLLKDAMAEALKQEIGDARPTKNTDIDLDVFRRFLWPLHILGLNGEPNKSKLEKVCAKLEVERYFALDFDAIADDRQPDKQSQPNSFLQFIKEFTPAYFDAQTLRTEISEQQIKDNISILEKVGIFVWKLQKTLEGGKETGTIETAIQELHFKTDTDLKDKLSDNKVCFQWDGTKKPKHRHKLFVHKQLSDENICNAVTAVLTHCQMKEGHASDMYRLVVFLCKMALRQQRKENS